MSWRIIRKDKNGTTGFSSNITLKKDADEIAERYQDYAGGEVEFIVVEEEKSDKN